MNRYRSILRCLFGYLCLFGLFQLEAKDFPERIYVLVAESLPDGSGDVALNIRAALMLQDTYNFSKTEVTLLVPPSSQESVDALLGKDSTLAQISLKDNPELPQADFLFSFSHHQERSALPPNVLRAAKHHFIYGEHAENGFYVSYRSAEAPYTLKQLEAELVSLGIEEAKDLQFGRIALAYTFNKAPTEAYIWATARMAQQKPEEKIYLFVKDSFGFKKLAQELPSNLILISHPILPLRLHESAIAHSHLPVLVTGTASVNIALEYQKALFYETRIHTFSMWKKVLEALTTPDTSDELLHDIKRRSFNSENIRTYLSRGMDTLVATSQHPNLVDYFYQGFGDYRINRIFTTPQSFIRSRYSLLMRWMRHMRNAYNLESNPRFERVRSHNQEILEIIALDESVEKSLKVYIKDKLHPAVLGGAVLLPAYFEDFLSAIDITETKKITYPDFFASDLIDYVQTMLGDGNSLRKSQQREVYSKWREILFKIIIKEEGIQFLEKIIPLWKKYPELRPNNRMINALLLTEGKAEVKKYLLWIKSKTLQDSLRGKPKLVQGYLKCKAWLLR
ncbi:MAG: hypothetical protein R3A80_01705 [Bdellovibrionota bacterium]